jgi:hypothetical protein
MKKLFFFLLIFFGLVVNSYAQIWHAFAYEIATKPNGTVEKYKNNNDGTLVKYVFYRSSTAYWNTYFPVGTISADGTRVVIGQDDNGRTLAQIVGYQSAVITPEDGFDSDGDGCADIYDSAPNDPSYSNCEQPNPDCQVDSDGDGVMDCNDPAPNDPFYPKQGDSDADGFTDDLDPYTNDDSDFKFKQTAYIKNMETGEIVGFEIQTDRGDTFSYNMDAEGENLVKFIDIGADKKPFDKSSSNLKTQLQDFTGSFVNGQVVNPSVPVNVEDKSDSETPVSDVTPNQSENLPDVTESEAPENSGNLATSQDVYNVEKAVKENSNITKQGLSVVENSIKENSRITKESGRNVSSNVKGVKSSVDKIADKLDYYLSKNQNSDSEGEVFDGSNIENKLDEQLTQITDLNTNLSDFTTMYQEKIDSDSARYQELETEYNNKKDLFNDLNVSDHYSSSDFSGEIVEGEDFEAITPLTNETFIQDFFSNNPVLSALSSSKIETENPKCNFTLVTSLGTHDMNLCFLESGFNKAGVILLSITTLFSLFVVVKK